MTCKYCRSVYVVRIGDGLYLCCNDKCSHFHLLLTEAEVETDNEG